MVECVQRTLSRGMVECDILCQVETSNVGGQQLFLVVTGSRDKCGDKGQQVTEMSATPISPVGSSVHLKTRTYQESRGQHRDSTGTLITKSVNHYRY